MSVYADSSFLVSLYTFDSNSTLAASMLTRARPPMLLTAFGEFEFVNALELRVFRRELNRQQVRAVASQLRTDIAAAIIERRAMPPATYDTAARLASRWTSKLGVRTLDVLHVASALSLRASAFYTFDRTQRSLAAAAGLKAA